MDGVCCRLVSVARIDPPDDKPSSFFSFFYDESTCQISFRLVSRGSGTLCYIHVMYVCILISDWFLDANSTLSCHGYAAVAIATVVAMVTEVAIFTTAALATVNHLYSWFYQCMLGFYHYHNYYSRVE